MYVYLETALCQNCNCIEQALYMYVTPCMHSD